MKSLHLLLAFFVTFVSFCKVSPAQTIQKGDVVVVPFKGEVSDAQTAFVRRTIKQAESAQASAYVIEMDTYGGSLAAAVEILQLLLKARIPTYTWVDSNAGSAGALIALASDHVYMANVSAIGAAAPVSSGGEELGETMTAKVVSYFSGYFRSAAEAKGRNPALAEAFINKDKEFRIGMDVLKPAGTLLTLTPQEAMKKYNGKPLLADGIADSLDQLKSEAKLTGATVRLEPSGFERIAQLVTLFAPLFLVAGIAAAYIEFKAPGFGVAGFLALGCFAIFFLGHYIAGLTGFEAAAVFVVGALLVTIELMLFPGVMLLAVIGTAMMLGSLLFAMVDYFPGDPWVPTTDMLVRPAINLGIAVILSTLIISLLARYFPSLPLFRRLVLATNATPAEAPPDRVKVGETGVALSILRPAGRAEFSGHIVDVVTDGEFLDPGAALRVVEVTGSRVVVTVA
jgi:membrane-bound serine protease (ClpP class)